MNDQLEPCPYCGSTHNTLNSQVFTHRVECSTCRAFGPKCRTPSTACDQWNHQSHGLRLEKNIENRQLLEHLDNFGDLPPLTIPESHPDIHNNVRPLT